MDPPPQNKSSSSSALDLPPTGSCSFDILGPVPSQEEVRSAIDSLQSFMHQISELQPEKKPSNGSKRVGDAFQLLQSDPAIQKLVAALATDKAVWDAVKKNEMVQKKLQQPGLPGESFKLHGGSCKQKGETTCDSDQANHLLRWIMDIASRITELIQKWQALVHVVRHPFDFDGGPPPSEQLLMDQRAGLPLLLAVVTLLIVVIARVQGLHCC